MATVRHYSLSFAFVFADFVDRADIGMVLGGSRPSRSDWSIRTLTPSLLPLSNCEDRPRCVG